MALKLSVAARNAKLDAVETAIGTSAVLKIFDGSVPANCAAADAGTKLVEMALPSDWMAAASSGAKAKSGTWQDAAADASGNAAYFRIYASDGTTCHVQGTVTASGGGGDIELQQASVAIVSGQTVAISTYTWTEGNA